MSLFYRNVRRKLSRNRKLQLNKITMKKIKIIFIVALLFAIAGVVGYTYVMYGGARDLSNETTNYKVTSKNFTKDFNENMTLANKKYLQKTVAVTGIVTEIHASQIIVDNTIVCNLKIKNATIKLNQSITIKGKVVGFDDFMGEIKLDQCFPINF